MMVTDMSMQIIPRISFYYYFQDCRHTKIVDQSFFGLYLVDHNLYKTVSVFTLPEKEGRGN